MPETDQPNEATQQAEPLLAAAVSRRAAIVLSLPTEGLVRHFRTKFVCENADGIWVELVTSADAQLQELIDSQQLVAGSFHGGNNRITFLCTLLRIDPTFRVDEKTALPAVCLKRPADFRIIQRRGTYRISVSPNSGLRVALWAIAEGANLADQPAEAQLKAAITDLSTGGVGIQLLADDSGQRPGIPAGSRIRCEISFKDLNVLLQGRLRQEPTGADATAANAGVMFDNLEIDVQGRQTLDTLGKIIDELQRAHGAAAIAS